MRIGERPAPAGQAQGSTSTRRALTRFALASLVVAVAVGIAGAVVSRRAAQTAATDDARTVTEVLAHSVIVPNLTDALVDGDAAAIRRMDQAVIGKVTTGSLVRVKLWTPEGKIVYSDEHRLIGASYPLAMDEQEVLRDNTVAAELSDLEAPENRFERDQGSLLEVYLPVPTPGGPTLLFETYSRYSSVTANAGAMWRQFVPIVIGALLLLLTLLQLPLAWTMARRLDASLSERERLLRRAVEATDTERRRIARDLHDGEVPDTVEIGDEVAELVFRVAQEAVRNVAEHSAAGTVDVRLVAGDTVALTVADDGIGFDPAKLADTPAGGHVGLLLLRDLARTARGSLEIDASPGRGTRLHLEVPAR